MFQNLRPANAVSASHQASTSNRCPSFVGHPQRKKRALHLQAAKGSIGLPEFEDIKIYTQGSGPVVDVQPPLHGQQRDLSLRDHFYLLNMSITSNAIRTKKIIKKHGRHHPASRDAVRRLFSEFQAIFDRKEPLNHVNVATLVHRTGMIVTGGGCTRLFLREYEGLLGHLSGSVDMFLNSFEARQIANIVWAYGKLGRGALTVCYRNGSVPAVLSKLIEVAETHCMDYNSQEVSNVIVGLASLGLRHTTCESLLDRLCVCAVPMIHEFNTQELASIVWGFGRLGYTNGGKFLQAIEGRLMKQSDGLMPQHISNVLWGLAKLEGGEHVDVAQLCTTLLASAGDSLTRFAPQGISNMMWALSKMMFLPEQDFLERVGSEFVKYIEDFLPQHVSNIVYAFAIFGEDPGDVCSVAKTYFRKYRSQFNKQETCNLLWALAMLDALDVETFSLLGPIDHLPEPEKRQVCQCIVHLKLFGSDLEGLKQIVPANVEEECYAAWMRGQDTKRVYGLALSVLLVLEKLGFVSHSRDTLSVAPCVVDTAYKGDGIRVVVEVSIPQHFFVNRKDRLKGPRLWAMRAYEAQGALVLRIDWGVWMRFPANGRVAYLKEKLDTMYGI